LKAKFLVLLLLLGILPLLAVGGAGLFALFSAPKGERTTTAASGTAPDLGAAQSRLKDASDAMIKAIQSALSDGGSLALKPTEAEFQSFLSAHPGFTAVYHLGTDGKPVACVPAGSTVVDASYPATEEFLNIKKRSTDKGKWPYLFYSRRGAPSLVFVNEIPTGGFVGAVLDIGSFFKGPGFAQGESFFLDAGTGQVLFASSPEKVGTSFSSPGDTWREGVLQDLKNKTPGSRSTTQASAVFSPLGIGLFGLVQTLPMNVAGGSSVPQKSAAAEGLTLEKAIQNPAALLLSPVALVLLGALGWVLVMGFLLRASFLKPIESAQKLLEAVVSGNTKVSEEALKKVGAPEVQALVRTSTQWADRLEREKEDLNRRREEDSRRASTQLQQRGQELADTVQKLSAIKAEAEQKDQAVSDKQQELDALKGMGEGLRNQAEQARGEIAKLKTQMSNQDTEAKQRETTLRQQIDLTATQANEQLKELESKLIQAVASANSITVSRVRVAAIKTMAEELKTTLGIIKGYVSSALGSAQSGITEKQQEFLGMVINRSARLEKFINDLVDIFQVEIDQETAPREEVALASEIEGMAFNFQPQADIKNIKIRVEEKGGPLPKVPIVRRRFTQLWNILYLQIIKDAPRGSQVPVTIERVGEDVKVTVLDPGLVVKPEHLPRLFDEFYDPKHPASTQLAGTGLKFALVKTILGAHGGGALAEKAETGTRLILTFPLHVKPKENPAAAILASVKLSPSSALAAGGLLGAVKPGTVLTKPAVAPGTPNLPSGMAAPPVKPSGNPGMMDSLISGKTPSVGSVLPPAPKAVTPPSAGMSPQVPKPVVAPPPGMPPQAPKPVVPPASAGPNARPPIDFEALLNAKTPPSTAPSTSVPPAAVPPVAPPPVPPKPTTAGPSIPSAPPSGAPSIAPPPGIPKMPAAPSAPAGNLSPTLKPPSAPSIPKPPAPPSKIVPTTLKPTAPPPGILDLDNQDGMKTENTPAAPPKPAPPPFAAPPSANAGKPIVKGLDKENGDDAGDLIE